MVAMQRTLQTMEQAHRSNNGVYFGDYPDWHVTLVTHRDADTLNRANWQYANNQLELYGDAADWRIERSGHWAIGWIEYIITRPGSESEDLALEMLAQMEQYPVLDDELYSQMEYDVVNEYWEHLPMRERIRELAEHGDSIFAARAPDGEGLYHRAETTYYKLSESLNQ